MGAGRESQAKTGGWGWGERAGGGGARTAAGGSALDRPQPTARRLGPRAPYADGGAGVLVEREEADAVQAQRLGEAVRLPVRAFEGG